MMPHRNDAVWLEFHVSREARDRYQFDDSLFSLNGSVVFANFRAARLFAQKMNQRRDLINYPEQAVRAGQINAMGLIHEITHYVFKMYRDEHPGMMQEALASLTARLGTAGVDVLSMHSHRWPCTGARWTSKTISKAKAAACPTARLYSKNC